MDGKKGGGKGRGFEKYFRSGGQGGRGQGDRPRDDRSQDGRPRNDRPRGDRPQGDRPRDAKPGDGRRYYDRDARPEGGRPYDRGGKSGDARPGEGRSQRPFREDRRYDKGPGPRFSKAPERPVTPAVFDDGRRAKPETPRYGRPVQPREDHPSEEPRYGRPVPGAPRPDRPAPRFGRPVPGHARPASKFDRHAPKFDRPAPAVPSSPVAPEATEADAPEMDNLLVGRNPIREALKAGRPIEKLLVAQGELSGSARELVAKAREAGIVVQFVDRARLDAVYSNHQGMLAYASAAAYSTLEDILALAAKKDEPPFVVALDGVTDPHNLGAIIRTAECCGAHGVIVPERRSAGLNPAAVKAAAGALSYLPVARVGNLSRALQELKEKGLWVIGCDMSGGDIRVSDLSGPVALVIGSEGEGISHLVLEHCDKVVSIPLKGQIASLNASVAAGIALYEVMRTRSGQ